MKLNMHERRTLLELLPEKSDYAGMKEIRRTREICALSVEEIQKHGKKQADGQYLIPPDKMLSVQKEIPLGEWMTETVRDTLRKMNEKKELEDKFVSLFEKFVVNYQQY